MEQEIEIPVETLPEPQAPVRDPAALPRLKRLTAAGFKSFARPMEFEFAPGVTGIVGPNGCGKSNVVDAIRWALGEQSAKSLRGGEMQDVIFNGAQGEAPMGYAEVTLTFSNCRGTLSADHDEVSVGRRLYRSGESEYFLNQEGCRLKDVRDLFLGTGIGMEAYSIVEQGKIDALLTSSSQDRRAVFDEAAGISKYRLRARQAQAKLERTAQDLARVEDLVREKEGRLGAIKRQARKAELFRAKTQRLAALRLAVNRIRHAGFLRELSAIGTEMEESARRVRAASEEREKLEADRAKADAALSRLDARRMALATEVLTGEGRVRLLESQREADLKRRQELLSDERSQQERAGEADRRAREARAEEGRAESSRSASAGALEEARKAVSTASEALRLAQDRVDAYRNRAAEYDQARQASSRRLEEARARATILKGQEEERSKALAQARAAAAEALEAARAVQVRLAPARAGREGAEAQLRQADFDAQSAEQELSRIREARAALEARAQALRAAARAALPDLAALGVPLRGIVGGLLEAAPADARMLDACLGDLARAAVVGSWDEARRLLDAAAQAGVPAACLVLEDLAPGAVLPDALSRRVRCEPALRPLVDALLGQVRVLAEGASPSEGAAVTPEGHYYAASNLARHAPDGAGGTLSLHAELAETDRALEQAPSLEAAAGTLARRRDALAAARASAAGALAAEAEAQRLHGEAALRERMASERADSLATESEKASAIAAAAEAEALALASQAPLEDLPAPLPGEDSLESMSEALDRRRKDDAEARVALAQREGDLDRAERVLAECRATARRSEDDRAESLRLSESSARAAAALQEADAGREAELARLVASLGVGRRAMAEVEEESREASAAQRSAAHALRETAEVVRRLEENHQGFVTRQSAAEARRTSLLQYCRESFGWTEEEISQPAEEPAESEGGLVQEAEALERQIKGMGPVNEEALQEEAELEAGLKSLTASRDDLRQASTSLAALIRELDARSVEQFLRVFEDLKVNFQDLFRRLFGGGRADILLEDPANVLESGVEIIARPPGREALPISLLSGGQKALSAVALIFAIFRSRPSSFYILDEVDAPLDESNIDRFLGLLQEFAQVSQFLIITHHRRTMRAAHTLYGVTMPTPGISAKMGIRFEDLGPEPIPS